MFYHFENLQSILVWSLTDKGVDYRGENPRESYLCPHPEIQRFLGISPPKIPEIVIVPGPGPCGDGESPGNTGDRSPNPLNSRYVQAPPKGLSDRTLQMVKKNFIPKVKWYANGAFEAINAMKLWKGDVCHDFYCGSTDGREG